MKKYILILPALLLLSPLTASAAIISLQATPATSGVGDIVRVDILLDSTIVTNVFSGSLEYSSATLEPVAVSDGNSIVSMWVTRPFVTNIDAPLTFAGITPGGFSGTKGMIFSVLFRAKAAGAARLSVGNIEVLRNDGAGGNEPTTVRPIILSIQSESVGGYIEPADETPPESFTAFLGSDPELFGGKAYIVFNAVDKGSGVDRYLVAESRLPPVAVKFFAPKYHETASPYALADQRLVRTIYIKAVDRAGNERLSIYPPQHLFTSYEKAAFLAILILVILLWHRRQGRRQRLNL